MFLFHLFQVCQPNQDPDNPSATAYGTEPPAGFYAVSHLPRLQPKEQQYLCYLCLHNEITLNSRTHQYEPYTLNALVVGACAHIYKLEIRHTCMDVAELQGGFA